jgi:hypothetical protein
MDFAQHILASVSTARNGATCIQSKYPSKEKFKLKQGATFKQKGVNLPRWNTVMSEATARSIDCRNEQVSLRKVPHRDTSLE